jgi:hypothetical protein
MARTFDNLFPAVVDFANLYAAWEKGLFAAMRQITKDSLV